MRNAIFWFMFDICLHYQSTFFFFIYSVSLFSVEVNEKDSLQCSLNFSRLILIYVKPFECVDIQRAMDYYFCLHKFESPIGEWSFSFCCVVLSFLFFISLSILFFFFVYFLTYLIYKDTIVNECCEFCFN